MTNFLSLKLTLGALNALAVVVVAAVTLGIALSTSLDALGAIGERHARVLTAVARTETEGLFLKGTDAMSAVLNVTQSRDWVPPTAVATNPSGANETLYSFIAAAHTAFVNGLPELDFVSLFLADGTGLTITKTAGAESLYTMQLEIADHPYDPATSNATNHLTNHWYRNYSVADHRLLSPDWRLELRGETSARAQSRWNQFILGTFNAFAPVIYTPRSLLQDDGIGRVTGAAAPMYYPSAPSRTPEHLGGFVIATISLEGLTEFLRNAKATPGTEAFAYDSLGYLLAATTTAPTFELRPDSSNVPTGCSSTAEFAVAGVVGVNQLVCQLPVYTYDSADLQAVASSEDANALLYPAAGAQPVASLTLPDGGRTFVASAKVQVAFRGLEVYLMLLMPEADVLGDVISGRNVAIGVTCGLVVLFTVLNVCVAMLLLGPLTGIAARMQRAARFEDDEADTSVSAMAEVAELQRAYYAMNAELNYISSFVPQSVLEARKAEREAFASDTGVPTDAQGDHADDVDDDLESIARSPSRRPSAASGGLPTLNLSQVADADSTSGTHESALSSRRGSVLGTPRSSGAGFSARAGASARGSPKMASAHSGASSASAMTLTMRNVSVVCGNVVGLHAATGEHGSARTPALVAEELAAFVTLTECVVRAQQGVVTFHGDRFLATFNAARPCASHATRAAVSALGVTHPDMEGSANLPSEATASCLAVSAGVATGRCAVGSVGSATLKTMSAVGPAVTHAAALERYARAAGTADAASGRRSVAMATQRTVSEMTGAPVVARTVDLANLEGWSPPSPSSPSKPTCVAELLRPMDRAGSDRVSGQSNANDNEWLYVVGVSSADPRCAYNGVFARFAAGEYGEAAAAFDAVAPPSNTTPFDHAPPPRVLKALVSSVAHLPTPKLLPPDSDVPASSTGTATTTDVDGEMRTVDVAWSPASEAVARVGGLVTKTLSVDDRGAH